MRHINKGLSNHLGVSGRWAVSLHVDQPGRRSTVGHTQGLFKTVGEKPWCLLLQFDLVECQRINWIGCTKITKRMVGWKEFVRFDPMPERIVDKGNNGVLEIEIVGCGELCAVD